MITLRCTRRALAHLRKKAITTPHPSTATLGSWYVNLVPTVAGELLVFVSDRSLLAVAVPADQDLEVYGFFVRRVANLLSMLQVPDDLIEDELAHMHEIEISKAVDRRILGAVNQIALHLQLWADGTIPRESLSLSDVELDMTEYPHKALGLYGVGTSPAEAARYLLTPTS